jgi:hypothetical protein
MEGSALKLTWKGRIIASLLGLLLLILISEGVLRVSMPHWRDFYSGWFMRAISVSNHGIVTTGLPDFDGYFAQNNGDFRVNIKINKFGLRNSEPVIESDQRIWVVGDSMAFGWGVEQDEMYSSALGQELGRQTYNVASPGTDVCGYQALLSRMPKDVRPTAVVVGLILENDMTVYDCKRTAREYEKSLTSSQNSDTDPITWIAAKRYLTGKFALYNFIVVGLKKIRFVRELFTQIGLIQKPIFYKSYISDEILESVISTTVSELEVLKKMLPENTPFSVLIAPGRFEILSNDKFYKRLRLAVRSELKKRNIAFVDPINSFKEAGYENIHFAHDGHWTALGHKIAADEIAKALKPNLYKK